MTNSNRIFKESYTIRPSTIFRKGWSLSTRKDNDNSYLVEIIVNTESKPLTMINEKGEYTTFESHELAQSYVDSNSPFSISAEFRNELLSVGYGNNVLEYTFEDGKILATWNQEKSDKCFLVINEFKYLDSYVKLAELEGKTVSEAIEITSDWLEQAYDDSMRSYADSYFNLMGGSNDNCSCRGGGCPHCEPQRFM